MNERFDVIIIGGGVVGSAVARELSRYQLKICVLEKELDVCNGVSGHNTGLLHSGILYATGSLRCECSMEGNAEFDRVAEELDVPFRRCGKLIVGFGEAERVRLEALYRRGLANGVPGLKMIDRAEIKRLEPNADGDFAIYVPSAGILDPFTYTIALAENAVMNGAKYVFDSEVTAIERMPGGDFAVTASSGQFQARWVINCAGLNAYKISELLGFGKYIPDRVKGQYEILDKKTGQYLSMPVYPTPNEQGEFDVHVTPTVDGNILVGPTIENIGDAPVDYDATADMIALLQRDGRKMFSYVRREYYIRNYAGVFPMLKNAATGESAEFVIEDSEKIPHAVNLVAIISPGVTSALPIARRVVKLVRGQEALVEKADFNPVRRGNPRFAELDDAERARLIAQDPDYGELCCRCECVSRAEVKNAIHNILGVTTVSGIKYRTRATMGLCQGGYCESRVTALIQEELGIKKEDVLLNKKGAYLFTGEVK